MADVGFYTQAQPNALLDTAQQAMGVRNAQLANAQGHLDLVKNQVGYLVDGFSALASKPDLSPQDFVDFGQRALQEGIISPDIYKAELANVQAAGTDPQALRGLATNYGLRALDAGQRFSAQYGSPSVIDTGNALVPVTSSPLTGVNQMGAPIQKTLSPSELSGEATVGVNSLNQPIISTKYNQLRTLGANPLTGQPESAPVNALTAASPQAGSAVATNGAQGIATAPAPGAAEAQTAVAKESGDQYAGDLRQAANFQQATLPLQKAIPALETLGTTGTGPGTDQINQIKSFAQSMGLGTLAGIDPDQIKSFDEAKKYLTQYVNQTGNTGTNDKLAAAFAGNPSLEISNAAATDVAKTALSLARLQNAQVRLFGQSGQPESQYSQYAKSFNADQDPRAYGLDLMGPAQRAALISSLKGPEKAKFVSSLRNAMSLGLVTPPGGASGGQ
jgi:hypothetical protein